MRNKIIKTLAAASLTAMALVGGSSPAEATVPTPHPLPFCTQGAIIAGGLPRASNGDTYCFLERGSRWSPAVRSLQEAINMCDLKYIQGWGRTNTQPIRVDGYWGDETQRAMIGIQSNWFTSTKVGSPSLDSTYHGTYQPGSRALMDFSYQGNGYQFCWGAFYHG